MDEDVKAFVRMISMVSLQHSSKAGRIADETELKPCPFCGKKNLKILETRQIIELGGTYGCRVFCLNCGGTTGYRRYQDAIDLWNMREGSE